MEKLFLEFNPIDDDSWLKKMMDDFDIRMAELINEDRSEKLKMILDEKSEKLDDIIYLATNPKELGNWLLNEFIEVEAELINEDRSKKLKNILDD